MMEAGMGFKRVSQKKKRIQSWKFLFLVLIPLSFFIKYLASLAPEFTEKYYSRGIYAVIIKPVSYITGLLPFSIAEIAIFIVIIYIPICIIYLAITAIRRHEISVFLPFLANIAFIASLLIFTGIMFWGINYERLPLASISGMEVRESSAEELESLCKYLIENTNSLRDNVIEDEKGIMRIEDGFESIAKRAFLGYSELSGISDLFDGKNTYPKPVLASGLMSYTGITGFYFPFTGEANVNTNIPHISLPAAIMHELAHQQGFAREDEANFIAYWVCMAHPDIDFKYSGSVLALKYSMNALYFENNQSYSELVKTYSPGLLRDLLDEREYWKQYEGITETIANKINDTYLKINRQEDGVKSYGRMVDLLLAYYRTNLSGK
jgi:hypothetical protein